MVCGEEYPALYCRVHPSSLAPFHFILMNINCLLLAVSEHCDVFILSVCYVICGVLFAVYCSSVLHGAHV